MNYLWLILVSTVFNVPSIVSSKYTSATVDDLIKRVIGEKKSLFSVYIDPSMTESGLDVFKILKTNAEGNVEIYGTTAVTAAWGFHYYLKEYCNCHISWDGDQLNLPTTLPNINIKIIANDKYRYYQNVVTTSYSFVWWNWTRWEREIDWMAMNGFNLALAFNGQEEIWRRVYLKLGLKEHDIDNYFTGPAFLSWNRMGNLRGWGGPLMRSWHERSIQLQKQILQRMRDFNITPVLPAFGGYVPEGFKRIFPSANVTRISWMTFQHSYNGAYFLSPLDKQFIQIGSLFMTEYINEFGTNHIYNSDSFNEMTPPNGTEHYLSSVSKAVYESMIKADVNAIWMMQGWLFKSSELFWTKIRVKALLTAVPKGRMLILDLQAELTPQYHKFESFFGQPFIWCMLHNFGGTLGLQGNLNSINQNIFKARNMVNSSMIGTGITPEGINQNYVVYDLMTEMAWRKNPTNLSQWLDNYAKRRYGHDSENALKAWILLKKSVYSHQGGDQHGNYIYVLRPSFKLKENVWYEKEDVWEAWDYLIKASQQIDNPTTTFLYDLVDVTRQSLQLFMDNSYKKLVTFFNNSTVIPFKNESLNFLNILNDTETILKTLPHFLLGKWLEDARNLGTTPLEKYIYELNARNQITLWGPYGEINDYANKQWSGLIQDYYYARWELFFNSAYTSLKDKKPFYEYEVARKIFENVEQTFSISNKKYPIEPEGNPLEIAINIHRKWRPSIN